MSIFCCHLRTVSFFEQNTHAATTVVVLFARSFYTQNNATAHSVSKRRLACWIVARVPPFIGCRTSRTNSRHNSSQFEYTSGFALCVKSASYDVAVSGLCLNFVPEPEQAVAEMVRAVRPGGTVATYVWDYAAGMEMIRYFFEAAAALRPEAAELDEGRRFPLCRPEALRQLFEGAGLRDVVTRAIEVPTVFESFEDYWEPFLGGQGPAPGYAASLDPDDLEALRRELRRRLPRSAGGAIALGARAWAVRGTK